MDHSLGLTLVELLISMTVMLLIMAALTGAFMSQSRVSVSEDERINLQMNLRAATDSLNKALRNAGFGAIDSFRNSQAMSGGDPDGGNITVNSFISEITNNDSQDATISSDSVIIVYTFKELGTVSTVPEENQVTLDEAPSPKVTTGNDFKRYLSFYPTRLGNVFHQVSAVSNETDLTFADSVQAEPGDRVFMVSPVRVKLDQGHIQLQIFSYQEVAVERSQHWRVAENIEDMQFQYSTDGSTWTDEVTSDLQDIKKIRFWLLGRSAGQVPDAGSQSFELTKPTAEFENPGDICLEYSEGDEECPIYRVGPFNDGYVRMLSQSEVLLRNAL
ncbi:MAG: PilW family protein [Desulfonatronovibrionaceae bacterium]